MVGVEVNLQDVVYSETFWQSGVSFQRFYFSLGRNFLDKTKQRI
nr:unnamed protein product [Callosobruchus analis]